MTSLTTLVSKPVTSLDGRATQNQSFTLSTVTKSGATCTVTVNAAVNPATYPGGIANGASVAFAGISGGSSLNLTTKTIDAGSFNQAAKTFTVGCTGSAAGTGGTITINNVVVSTSVITVTMPSAHGFASGQTVTIQGAGAPLDGPWGISCTPAPGCAGATTFTFNLPAGQSAGLVNTAGITASAESTTDNATFAAGHGSRTTTRQYSGASTRV